MRRRRAWAVPWGRAMISNTTAAVPCGIVLPSPVAAASIALLDRRKAALTPDDTPLMCQAAVPEPRYARHGAHWHQCTRRSRVTVIHHQDGRPIFLCRQHAKIHAEDVFTPIVRWEPKAEGIAPPTTQGCAQD